MSAEPYEILRYAPSHAKEVARLRALLSPSYDPAEAAALLDWKYARNPYLPEPLIYLALCDGKIVAMRGFYGALWEIGGERRVIPCAGDLIVAPEHRDKGVITRIMRVAEADLAARGFSHIFGLSGGPVTTMSALAQGFKRIAGAREHYLYSHPSPGQSAEPFAAFDRAGGLSRLKLALRGIRRAAAPDIEAMAALIARLPGKTGLRHVRDAAYLDWRYRNPIVTFRFLYSRRRPHGRLDGYLVLAAQNGQPNMPVFILDWEGESSLIKRRLLRSAVACGVFGTFALWGFGYDDADLQTAQECDFVPETETGVRGLNVSVSIMVKPLAPVPDDPVLDPARWDFRMLYSDYC
jgi:GNAT superfamily N-acetyltransferase